MTSARGYKVVITDQHFPSIERERRVLAQINATLVVAPATGEATLAETCRDADGLMINRSRVSRPVIEAMEKCKVLSAYGIGVDGIDLEAASEKGILVVNLPGFCAEEVSERAILLLLALRHKLLNQANAVRTQSLPWAYQPFAPIHRVSGTTLGLVGIGAIGRAVTRKAQGLGMRVVATDPYVSDDAAAEIGVEMVSLPQLLEQADHISLHVGVTPETRGMIGAEEIAQMKSNACLINTSRGPIVDQRALLTALREGRIAGAGLDVVENDPPAPETYETLFQLENVIVTPHTAWYSEESLAYLQMKVAENVVRVLRGEEPINVVNRQALESR